MPDIGDVSTPIWFSPHGLANSRWETWAFGGVTALLLAVFVAGLVAPKSVETLPAGLLIVAAAAWLFSTRHALAITVLALTLPLAELIFRDVHPISAAIQICVIALLAIGTRVYSTRLRRLLVGSGQPRTSMTANAFGLENLAHLMEGSIQGVAAVDSGGVIRYANQAASELLGRPAKNGEPDDFYVRVAAEDRERVRAAFHNRTPAGYVNFNICRPGGPMRTVQAMHTSVMVRHDPLVALTLRDISQVNDLQKAASALAETAAALAVTQPLEETIAAIARRVIEVTHACACAVFLLEGEESMRLAGSWGLPPGYEAAANQAIKAGAHPPVFQAMRTRSPVFVEDLTKVIRTNKDLAPMRELVRDVSWQRAVAFPMIHAGRPVGGLAVYLRSEQRLDDATLEFLATIAGQAASAAEISRLVTMAQGEAAANERLHLSRELHDSLSQRLYGIILGARSIEMGVDRDRPEVAEPVDYILDLAQGGLAEMRDIVLQLRPEALAKDGLMAAIAQHGNAITARHQVEVTTAAGSEPDVPLDTKLAAYRIVIEALNNVAKHSGAAHAWVRTELVDGYVEVEVRDDGCGFDPAVELPGHFGLRTMRERAGQLEVISPPEGGTTVLGRIPVLVPAVEP